MSELFEQLTIDDQSPIYSQIVAFVLRSVAAGDLAQGTEIPSRRAIAGLLGINPMTVQKAFRILEDEGIIQTHPNAKSVIAISDERRKRIGMQMINQAAQDFVGQVQAMNLEYDEMIELLNQHWNED